MSIKRDHITYSVLFIITIVVVCMISAKIYGSSRYTSMKNLVLEDGSKIEGEQLIKGTISPNPNSIPNLYNEWDNRAVEFADPWPFFDYKGKTIVARCRVVGSFDLPDIDYKIPIIYVEEFHVAEWWE